jgi:hypothetical protein
VFVCVCWGGGADHGSDLGIGPLGNNEQEIEAISG